MAGRQAKQALAGAVMALAFGVSGATAQETAFGCHGLLDAAALPVVEGDAGQFFRVDPDLRALNRMPEAAIDRLARLSRALERAGTRLIYVPTPTKALAIPQNLPPLAGYLGYDADLATSVHDEMLGAMRKAGIAVVDARHALSKVGQAAPIYFGPDPRPNMLGQKTLAQAVARRIAQTPGFGALPKTRFTTLAGAEQPLDSVMRFRLQQRCESDLPPVSVQISMASVAPGDPQPSPQGRVVVIASDMTGDPALNFAGHLQEALGLAADVVHVPGGNAFDAIAAYMTSRDFAQRRPAYLVWENPVWQGLGDFGDQPMAELTAAASLDACRVVLPVAPGAGGKRLTADLGLLEAGRAYTLALDADSLSVGTVWFHTPQTGDLMRTRSIHRAAQAPRTGRFYMPLSGDGVLPPRVEIETDAPFGPQPRLTACLMEDTQ